MVERNIYVSIVRQLLLRNEMTQIARSLLASEPINSCLLLLYCRGMWHESKKTTTSISFIMKMKLILRHAQA